MNWFFKSSTLFLFPAIFVLAGMTLFSIVPALEGFSLQITILLLALASCGLILLLLPSLPKKITPSQRLIVASSLLSIAGLMFVSRSLVSLFFGSDYMDYEVSAVNERSVTGSFSEAHYEDDLVRSAVSKLQKALTPGDRGRDFDEESFFDLRVPAKPLSQVSSDTVATPEFQTEQYRRIYENGFLESVTNPVSTFSIDVDTASYANARRFLKNNSLPPKDAVRAEEFINYFSYDYASPTHRSEPFLLATEYSVAPWNKESGLLKVALQGYDVAPDQTLASNLVFLIDVSGSMSDRNKLPLLKSAFHLLVNKLGEKDRVSIVVYAGAAGEVLTPTSGANKEAIRAALERLDAGGSTAGGDGIQLAYKLAKERFIPGGNNRVILATDGDFNVGVSSNAELVRMIEKERESGVFLSVLGFGGGNYQDTRLEQLANKGNGNYSYIDSASEAKKVLVHDLRGTLFTIAKDVKIQIEFNPRHVKAYRLIGYENRMLAREDFNDDTKDAGELGSGHTVTALYEIIPVGSAYVGRDVDPLRYQDNELVTTDGFNSELANVKLRYKLPTENTSRLTSASVAAERYGFESASENLRFASAVAQFAMLLRGSEFRSDATYQSTLDLARGALGEDKNGYRREFLKLVETAQILSRQP